MKQRFGLHRIWFCYDDERSSIYTLDDCISPCKEIYDNEKDALEEAVRLDLEIMKKMSFNGLRMMFELDISKFKTLINSHYESGWEEYLSIDEIELPFSLLSNQQLINFREQSKITFHQVIEHKTSSRVYFVRLSEAFWDKRILEYLLSKKHIANSRKASIFDSKEFEEHSSYASDLWIKSNRVSGLFLFNRKNNKAIIPSEEEAWEKIAYTLIDLFRLFPHENILYKKGIKEIAQYPKLCQLTINESRQLKKYLAFVQNNEAAIIRRKDHLETEKLTNKEITAIKNFMLTLKVKPFYLYSRLEKVNGQIVHNTRIYHEYHY